MALNFIACKNKGKGRKNTEIHLAYMDITVRPSDKFFRYVNEKWLDQTEISSDRSDWGSFDELRQNTDIDVLAIFYRATASNGYKSDIDQGKAINLYKTIMDNNILRLTRDYTLKTVFE